jgi:hypothetical protein
LEFFRIEYKEVAEEIEEEVLVDDCSEEIRCEQGCQMALFSNQKSRFG